MDIDDNAIQLTYLGNSCIMITSPDGTRIVSDPYGDDRPPGLMDLPKDLTAEAVTVSHIHEDHNNISAVGGGPQVFTEPGVTQIGQIKITGLMGWEGSPEGPSKTMRNIIFVYEILGIKIVQLGDSGIITDSEVLKSVENADLVVVNIDGYVIAHENIIAFMHQIKARTVLLAHYTLSGHGNWCGAPTAEEFVSSFAPSVNVQKSLHKIEVVQGMPEQIAIIQPFMLISE
jgi:L-ascorbate metabolism protein UlaG (beta-lactamase superfamily)